jgi:hypothetical protein
MNDQGKAEDLVWQELGERVDLQRGTNCELDADGKYKCESCQCAREKFEAKGKLFEWRRGDEAWRRGMAKEWWRRAGRSWKKAHK